MAEFLDVVLAGESLRLLADRAMYWPSRRRLFVADVHLGKDDSFRGAGIALPVGVTRHDLDRLSGLIKLCGAESVWVLGDLLHGARIGSPWLREWQRFRERHDGIEFLLLEGNHDRAAAHAGLGIERCVGPVDDGPFAFAHVPVGAQERNGAFAVCGHVHPVVRVPGLRGRFPAFAVVGSQLILPAFSAFTGGWLIEQAHGRYACLHGHLVDAGPTRQLPAA